MNFRFYCAYDGNGNCTRPPTGIVGSQSNSSVWGRFVAPLVIGSCPTCTGGPSLEGNIVRLGG